MTEKALPSSSIQESLSDIDDVIPSYPNLKGAKLPTLAMKRAKEAVFGESWTKASTTYFSYPQQQMPSICHVTIRVNYYTRFLGDAAAGSSFG